MNSNYIAVLTNNHNFYQFLDLLLFNISLKRINDFQSLINDEDCIAFVGDSLCYEDLQKVEKNINKPVILLSSSLDYKENFLNFYYKFPRFISKQNFINKEFNDLYRLNTDTYFSIEKHSIITKNQSHPLTNLEFRLIYYLLKNRGKVISVDSLIDRLDLMTPSSLYVCVKKLRDKIEENSDSPSLLVYLKNKGYYLNIDSN
ncbi:winged helix-turn-helix domain-containing protein [Lysinibacillus agricola]|uniref:Winged helix-turn-helix domain-containing protein n=1 Tax=Lysinibacillus agricola TaxID=2590012 RepID=A0ABX7ARB2_9BACI|nr:MULTISPECIES: helix-turn-helix domain-containing protein [Lysinibacillus]KOS61634.1 hypothetical protein AN161_16745 [Lysinibacillus sp. FJAT-14222]QQP12351.1 winged helix-turn-helix domain-containing protein [Lysinibacillus agricola]